jgi:hypothetical protein
MVGSAGPVWALWIGISDGPQILPIDRWDPSIREPLLTVARLLHGELPEAEGFRFCIRDASGRVLWHVNALRHEVPQRGEVFVGDYALMPEVTKKLDVDDLRLNLEFDDEVIAVLPFSPPLRGSTTAPWSSPTLCDDGEQERIAAPLDGDEVVLVGACERMCEEWEEVRAQERIGDLELQSIQDQLDALSSTANDIPPRARELVVTLTTGDLHWLTELSGMIDEIRVSLAGWRHLLEPLGTGAEREKLIDLLRQASAARSFYQLKEWGWLADTAAMRERRTMIEAFLKRHEEHGFQG